MTGELPLAAWLLGGAVAAWVAGFDLLYAVFDIEVDRAQGLHSFPARFGVPAASSGAPACSMSRPWRCSPAAGRELEPASSTGSALRAVAALLAYEHAIVSPGRPAPAGHGVLHAERRDQHRVLRASCSRTWRRDPRAAGSRSATATSACSQGIDFELPRGGFFVVTGPNGSGKTTLLRLCAGLAAPTAGELEVDADRARIGFLGHEPLVYSELTALENLDLYGRLYACPERRERIGMLLERFGLWDARDERVSTFSRGMPQRLALCRSLLHDPELLILDEPYSALDEAGADLLDRELAELRATRDVPRRHPRPAAAGRRSRRLARARMRRYFHDAAALARKDLLLELRGARDAAGDAALRRRRRSSSSTSPCPTEDAEDWPALGLLWVAILFTALLGLVARLRGRARAAARWTGCCSRRATAARSGSAKSLAALAFLALDELVALPAFALFFSRARRGDRRRGRLANIGICAVGTLLAAMASATRARELLLPLLFLPLAIPLVVGGVGASVADEPGRYLGFLALYDAVFAIISLGVL